MTFQTDSGTKAFIPQILTIADLKTIKPSKNNVVFNVVSYAVQGDNGGGTFIWNDESLETDNSGTIIQATGVTTGRWKRQFSGPVNVQWFGARGDYEQYIDGQNTTASNNQVPWRAFASVDGATYIGKKIFIAGAGISGAIYEGTITAYNSGTHNWTVSPSPSTTVTNAANIYATDNSVAFQKATDYTNLLTNNFYITGYDLRSARLYVSRGTYYVPTSIIGCIGIIGDNATIRGNAGSSNLFVPVSGDISNRFDFNNIVFYNFHSIIKTWATTFNGLQANVTFSACKFQNIDYPILNTRCGNMFALFDHCEFENSRVAKGFWATCHLTKPVGTSFGGTPPNNFTAETLGTFTDGLFLVGGTEDGYLCPTNVGAAITIDGAGLSPLVNTGTGAVDGQAWIIARRLTNISITGSRFGGESAGLPLIRLEEESNPVNGSADGSNIAIGVGTLAVSSNLPAIVFHDAAPIRVAISSDSEIGNFGGIGRSFQWTQTALDKSKHLTNWMQVALNKVGSVGNINEMAIALPPGSSTFPSTQMLGLERSFSARERLGFPNQNYDTSGTVFDASSATANTASAGTAFNVINIQSSKYYSNDGYHATGTLTKWFPDNLSAGWYTAILPYRTLGLGVSSCSFEVHSGSVVPLDVPLEDTGGEIVTASYSWYHDGYNSSHTHPLIMSFDIPSGGSSTNFIEFAAASLVKGRWGGNYLPLHSVPVNNWFLQGAKNWDPPSVNDNAQTTTTVTVTGALLGDRVQISLAIDLQGMVLSGYVSSADTVTAVLRNNTGSPINLGSSVLIAETRR